MSTANKRILIFSTAYLPFVGGAEIAVKEITDRLPGLEFEMVTLNLDGRQKAEEKVGNVLVHRIGGGGYVYKLLYPFAALYLARRLHKKNLFSKTWSIMASFSGFAALFFKFFYPKITFILTLQEGDPLSRPQRRAALVYPLFVQIFRKADRVQAISTFLANFAKKMGAKVPVEVIPNGVDLPLFSAPVAEAEKQNIRQKLPGVSTRLVTVSRLVEKNGVGDIVAALPLLPESVGLIIVGSGPLEKSLKEKVAKLKLSSRVVFAGLVAYKELPKWLAASDVFVRPSLSEGMGNSFIEAMAAGVPVIGTPVGGITDFLRDRETGLLCQPQNPQSIAEAVKVLLADPSLKVKLIENGKKLAQGYDWGIIAERIKNDVFSVV
jgi:glycosyltransferase involved in cell wall biosynthesis